MKVIIVAYNQFELLQMEIEALRLLAGIEERDLIIVCLLYTSDAADEL